MARTTIITSMMRSAIPTEIHSGERTHHQLQLITWQSLRMMKAMVRRPLNPMPDVDAVAVVLFDIFLDF